MIRLVCVVMYTIVQNFTFRFDYWSVMVVRIDEKSGKKQSEPELAGYFPTFFYIFHFFKGKGWVRY